MDEFLKADIFFFIASCAVLLVTALFAVALWYVIRILRAIADIAERVREGSETFAEDLAHARERFTDGSFIAGLVARGVSAFRGKSRSRRRSEDS